MVFQTVNTASPSTDLQLGRNITSGDVGLGDFVDTGSISIGGSCTTGDIVVGFSAAKTGSTIIGHQSSAQDLELRTQTGDIDIGVHQTTGGLNLGTNPSRNALIDIGEQTASSDINIRTGGVIRVYPMSGLYLGGVTSGDIFIGHAQTNGDTSIGHVQTTGELKIGTSASRTSDITIGNVLNAGDIDLMTTGAVNIGGTTTGTVEIGVTQTSGSLNIGTSASRTSDITIGNAANTGDIDISTTGDINLTSAKHTKGTWTPILYDHSKTDVATYTLSSANYARQGNLVHCTARLVITGKGTLTSTERVIVAGLPFPAEATGFRCAGSFTGSIFEGSTYTQITPMLHDTFLGTQSAFFFYGIDPPNSQYGEIVWSDVVVDKQMVVTITYII